VKFRSSREPADSWRSRVLSSVISTKYDSTSVLAARLDTLLATVCRLTTPVIFRPVATRLNLRSSMAKLPATEWIWRDGEFIRWNDAQVHVLSHSMQFGSSVFEGIRCYETPRGPAVFRLEEHLQRLLNSCRI